VEKEKKTHTVTTTQPIHFHIPSSPAIFDGSRNSLGALNTDAVNTKTTNKKTVRHNKQEQNQYMHCYAPRTKTASDTRDI
jgi:hypothetical protein